MELEESCSLTSDYTTKLWCGTETKQMYRSKDRKPRNKPAHYDQLIYHKGGKTIQRRKDNFFNKWCWENWTATWKRVKLEHSLTPYTK